MIKKFPHHHVEQNEQNERTKQEISTLHCFKALRNENVKEKITAVVGENMVKNSAKTFKNWAFSS